MCHTSVRFFALIENGKQGEKDMKIIKVISCVIILIFIFGFSAFANGLNDKVEITRIEMSESEQIKYRNEFSIEVKSTDYSGYKNSHIFNCDVSDDGRSVLFLEDATVIVLDPEGEVEHILKFRDEILNVQTASGVAVFWKEDSIELLMSYDIACNFTVDGELLDIYKYESNRSVLPKNKSITVGEYNYRMKHSNFLVGLLSGQRYDRFVRTSEQGEEILFDSEALLPSIGYFIIVWCLGMTGFGVLILVKTKNYRKKRLEKQI